MEGHESLHTVALMPDVARRWPALAEALAAAGIAVRTADDLRGNGHRGGVLVMHAEAARLPGGPLPGSGSEHGVRVIVLARRGDVAGAVRAMRAGAHDIVETPPDPDVVVRTVRAALHTSPVGASATAGAGMGELVGTSSAMQALRVTLEAVAPVDANVLLVGESGTGKELVARALHTRSPRAAQPFIAVNCAALPRDILENELFGHERGAFTGALRQKPGCFELADGGTLFLDEIGEMGADVQAKLLRVIEQQAYRRLGGKSEITVDVRIIAATNRDIIPALEEGSLRSDLYYRLSVVEILLPPLREREEDVLVLARHFLGSFAERHRREFEGFSADALEALRSYAWPGNVRELRNAVERAVLLSPGPVILPAALPVAVRGSRSAGTNVIIPVGSSVEEAERRLILETLASVGNNKARAARVLGVSRKTLHNKLNAFRVSGETVPG